MTVTVPGPTLGVVGGGQLGRMLAEAAAPLGVEVVVLDPTPECPASPVARDQIVGDFDDPDAFRELAARVDALTFEIELADAELLDDVAAAFDLSVNPAPETLSMIEDKLVQKRALDEAGVPVPPFRRVDDADDLRAALDEFGSVMLKARTGGYDGRGNVPVTDPDDAEEAMAAVGGPAMAETFVDFERELSVIAVQGEGEIRTFPAGENVHEEEILRETILPARTTDEVLSRAEGVARDVLDTLSGRGVFGIELFETADGSISVNEIAPRPHNSGHWTIEGARTSQFEQHVRAVLGWPLGSTRLRCPTVMANVLGTVDEPRPARLGNAEAVLGDEDASLHWYGKEEVRPLRKMGHLTVTGNGAGDDHVPRDLLAHARDVRDALTFE
ncbi:5-(carboxyamino)imidazole ribonucleotide synthase [Halobellus rarus]|uniref:N5-carboxyaminoimidazole ribonucleotide synthase n=1 Tax=Halobellus rarus TaxID=1126237 RepID=A0ABD6CQW6_9EURY